MSRVSALKTPGKAGNIAANPTDAGKKRAQAILVQSLMNKALRHYEAAQYADAESVCLKVLSLDVRNAYCLYLLGMVGYKTSRFEMGERMIRRAIGINDREAFFHSNLGNTLLVQSRTDEAIACYQKALELNPDFAEAHFNLGNGYVAKNQHDLAFAAYQKAIELSPEYADAHRNLGSLYRTVKNLEKALECYQRAYELTPNVADVCSCVGDTLHVMGRVEEAISYFLRTLKLDPNHWKAANCLGNAHFDLGYFDKSVEFCQLSVKIKPDYADALMNISLLQLLHGDYVNGWRNYEVRWKAYKPREVPRPLWLGAPLNGARILLHHEQGLGDSLQFLRYVPMVLAAGGQVVLELPAALTRLGKMLPGLTALVTIGEPIPNVHCHAPLMTLPLALGTTYETIPAQVPYLTVPPDAAQMAAAREWPTDLIKVGLVWAGNASHPKDRDRSIPLRLFEPLYTMEGVQFYSLQLGPPAAELPQAGGRIIDLAPQIQDMADTAAFMAQMDLIISVDTSPVHLAGALAKPTWALIPFAPDWRWGLEREDSPWYPTMRLYRRPIRGQWEPVMERMRAALAERVEQRKAAPSH